MNDIRAVREETDEIAAELAQVRKLMQGYLNELRVFGDHDA